MSQSSDLPALGAFGQPPSRSRHLVALILVAAATLIGTFAYLRYGKTRRELVLYTVDRGEVVVRSQFVATLSSAQTAEILCEVAAHRHPDQGRTVGPEVLWVVPNGKTVTEGELLVEFKATLVRELLDDWQLKAIKSTGFVERATLQLENQQSKHETDLANASEQLELTLQVEDTIGEKHRAQLSELLATIKYARQGAKVAEINVDHAEAADRLGLPGDDPERARVRHLESLKDLGQALGEFTRLTRFDHQLKREELAAAAARTHRALAQSQRNHEATMQQMTAERHAAQKALDKELERVRYYEQQLIHCKVHAPFSGVIQHTTFDWEEPHFVAGMVLRERQRIFLLHDLTQPRLRATIHTPAAKYLRRGLPASIRFLVSGSTSCSGEVTDVTLSGAQADVTITPNEPPRFPPDTTAEVEIIPKRCHGVVRIPVESVFDWNDQAYCFLKTENGLQQHPLETGTIGDVYAEVLSGLDPGDSVVRDAAALKAAIEQ